MCSEPYRLPGTSPSGWSPSYSSQSQQSTHLFITPPLTERPLLRTELLPGAGKCGESAGLSAMHFSLASAHALALARPLFLLLRRLHAVPVQRSARQRSCSHRWAALLGITVLLSMSWDKAEPTGSWSQKGIFSVEAACSSVNVIKGGFFLGEAGCSLRFALKSASCIGRTIPHEGGLQGTAH